ncbi:MAG: hypothetical protein J6A22_01020 [Bacteroidales bacterium]|nr:hypothetical protein [Bacteroidales bacterium]
MKKLYQKLLDLMNISGRDLAVFLLALLLAFVVWLIHNLSLRYNDYLSVPVQAHANLNGHSSVSSNSTDVVARCRTTGYKVILTNLKKGRRPVGVKFSPSVMHKGDEDLFYVTSADLQNYSHLIFGDDVTVEYFVSDTLYFRFPQEQHKKVPVHPVYTVTYRPQYMNDGELAVYPDSVIVYGEPYQLELIDKVYTKPIRHHDLDRNVQGLVSLETVRGVRFSENEIHYILDVIRYVEMTVSRQVVPMGFPEGKQVLMLPSSVEVKCRCAFPLVSNLEDMEMNILYEDFQYSLSGLCPVRMKEAPRGLIDYECSPVGVECIIED